MNTPINIKNMRMFPKKQNRFSMSYKEKEVPIYIPMENTLMNDLGIATRSDLHKYCIKTVHNLRTAASLNC